VKLLPLSLSSVITIYQGSRKSITQLQQASIDIGKAKFAVFTLKIKNKKYLFKITSCFLHNTFDNSILSILFVLLQCNVAPSVEGRWFESPVGSSQRLKN